MKKIVVLGTNAGQADLIHHMKDRGWFVVACSNRTNEVGAVLADTFHRIDITDVDAVEQLAREVDADLVYSVSSDLAMTTAVTVSERLGTPYFFGSEIVDLFNQKHRLRAHLNDADLSPVGYRMVSGVDGSADWDIFPCIVKPVDAQGQRGVQRVVRKTDLTKAVEIAKEAGRVDSQVIIEEFLDGIEVSCNVLVRDGAVVISVVSERLVHDGPVIGIPLGHLIPCYNATLAEQHAVQRLVEAVVASLALTEGCLYFQMKLTPKGPRIIEIAPRLDGCHMWRLIKHIRGIDFLAETIKCLLNEAPGDLDWSGDEQTIGELSFQQQPPGGTFDPTAFPVPDSALHHEYRYESDETVYAVNGHLEVVGYYVHKVPLADAGYLTRARSMT